MRKVSAKLFAPVVACFLIATLTLTPLAFPVSQSPAAKGAAPELQSVKNKQERDRLKAERLQRREEKRKQLMEERKALYEDVELVAPYWAIGNGFESTLVINNTFTRSIEVTPVLYAGDGKLLSAAPLTISKLASLTISIRDIIHAEGYGQVALRFYGEPLELNAAVIVSNTALSLATNHSFENRKDAGASRMDGVFYVPSPTAQTQIALSNTSDQSIDAAISIREEQPGSKEAAVSGPNRPVTVGPHETQLVQVSKYLNSRNTSGHTVAVVVAHTGPPEDLIVHGMVMDTDGFSANIRFLEPDAMIALNLISPIYEHRTLRPLVLLNNTGGTSARVKLQAQYTVEGQTRTVNFSDVKVAPRNAAHVDLSDPVSRLPENATDIGLKIVEADGKDGILADMLLIDSSGSQVLQLVPKGYSGEVHPSHGFPFRIDGSLNTIITVANPSNDEIEFDLHLIYDGDSYTYKDGVLKPGEIRHVDVRALRDQQIPGQRKTIIPKTVMFGQGKVNFRPKIGTGTRTSMSALLAATANVGGHKHHGGPGNGGIAGATIFDSSAKMSYSTICLPAGWFPPIDIYGEFDGTVGDVYTYSPIVFLLDDSFYVYIEPEGAISFDSWDGSIVSPSFYENSFTLVGAGATWVVAHGPYTVYCAECPYPMTSDVTITIFVYSNPSPYSAAIVGTDLASIDGIGGDMRYSPSFRQEIGFSKVERCR